MSSVVSTMLALEDEDSNIFIKPVHLDGHKLCRFGNVYETPMCDRLALVAPNETECSIVPSMHTR